MNEYIISNLSGFGGAIIGGVFSLFAAGITLKYQYKKEQELQKFRYLEEDKKWLREKRIDLF
ncbi:MAG: hypothetical protein K2J35_02910, partial [Eubacterium sp.]|nr:hypothetical protein [Eubacterium sp.]